MAMVRAPLDHGDGRDRILLSATSVFAVFEDGLWLDGLLERPGPTVHPMAWVDTRATPKQPAFSGCFGQAVRGRGPSVGHGYKNVKGQGTVTTPCRRPCMTLSGLVRGR